MKRATEIATFFFTPEERPELEKELLQAHRVVTAMITRPIHDYQIEALTSLVADLVGHHAYPQRGTLQSSDLIKNVNDGMLQLAAPEFFKFVYINGRIDKRLWAKRDAEQLLFRRGRLVL